jgi:hypothetical protein
MKCMIINWPRLVWQFFLHSDRLCFFHAATHICSRVRIILIVSILGRADKSMYTLQALLEQCFKELSICHKFSKCTEDRQGKCIKGEFSLICMP